MLYTILFIVCFLTLLFAVVCIGDAIIKSSKTEKEVKKYKIKHPQCVLMRLFNSSSSSDYIITVFSVNGEKPIIGGMYLLLPVGNNEIIANYKPFEKDVLMMKNVLSLIFGLFTNISIMFKPPSTMPQSQAVNGIKINIETKRNCKYEMKADPYEETINITCLEGDKHNILKFK